MRNALTRGVFFTPNQQNALKKGFTLRDAAEPEFNRYLRFEIRELNRVIRAANRRRR